MGGQPSRILPGYWQGGENTYKEDIGFFERNSIESILSVCDTPAHPSLKVQNLFIHKMDVPSTNLYEDFPRICKFLHAARCENKHVYVHCACGISRATTSSCAYLMAHLGMSCDEAFRNVHRARPIVCPNAGFFEQLRRWDSSGDAKRMGETLRELHGDLLVAEDLAHFLSIWEEEDDATGHNPNQLSNVDVDQQKESLRKHLQQYKDRGFAPNGRTGLAWLQEKRETSSTQSSPPILPEPDVDPAAWLSGPLPSSASTSSHGKGGPYMSSTSSPMPYLSATSSPMPYGTNSPMPYLNPASGPMPFAEPEGKPLDPPPRPR